MTKKNRSFPPAEKVRILKRHLTEQIPISTICDEEGLAPTQFYAWQKQFFENATKAFEREDQSGTRKQQVRIDKLERQLDQKNEVIAQIAQEHINLKKELGEI